jgi:Icc-related predicted phosphoesterase
LKTSRDSSGEILPFLDWFAEQDYSHLVMIAGNHDFGFEKEPGRYVQECKDRNIILLNDSGYDMGGIKVHGSPIQPWFHSWAYNRHRGADIKRHWDMIPEDTEILITHGPPHMILDDVRPGSVYRDNVGCEELAKRILQTKVKLHVFGHIHESAGYKYLDGRTYVNASSLDGMYMYVERGYKRIVKQGDDYFVENEHP